MANGGSSASPRETAGSKAYREGIQADCGCLRGALFPCRRNLLVTHQAARHLAFQATDLPVDWKLDSIPRSISHIGVVRRSADRSRTSYPIGLYLVASGNVIDGTVLIGVGEIVKITIVERIFHAGRDKLMAKVVGRRIGSSEGFVPFKIRPA